MSRIHFANSVCTAAIALFLSSAYGLDAPTRISAYDWQCQDASGNKISDHQRIDLAYVSCSNASGAFLQGGRYHMPAKPSVPPPVSTGTSQLTWTAPTKNTDGSPLTNLAGYEISYGITPSDLTKTVTAGKTATSLSIPGLPKTMHYFVMRAIDTAGVKSDPTNMIAGVPQ